MTAGDRQPAAGDAFPGGRLRGARVLLVDDSDVIRDVTRSLLEEAGIVVEEATDGAAAVQLMRDDPSRCELILMDVQMPVMDGMAATRALRAALAGQTPPVIAVTAQASVAERLACREAGMCDHLPKPLDPAQLIDTLCRWLAPTARKTNSVHHVESPPDSRHAQAPALPDLPGFDWQAGLRCVSGNTSLLLSMLRRFGANNADVVAQLRALVTVQDYREARRVAHTLKGAAATLGAMVIAQRAGQVEAVLLQRAESAAGEAAGDAAQLDAALGRLHDAMQQALPSLRAIAVEAPPAFAPVAAPRASLPQDEVAAYQDLRQLLAGNCYAARKAFSVLRARLGADDADWRAAAVAVDALDFGTALARLDARYPDAAGKS